MQQQENLTHHNVQGPFCAILSFLLWGLLPIYWKQLKSVSPFEILCHRICWAFVFLLLLSIAGKRLLKIVDVFQSKKQFLLLLLSTVTVWSNWYLYIWGVNNNHILDTSLGYYINPVGNMLLGIFLFKEKMSRLELLAVILVAAAVLFITIAGGYFPWLALAVAFTFCLYGMIHKLMGLSALTALMMETMILAIPSFIYLLIIGHQGQGAFGHSSMSIQALLMGAGVVTGLPLLLFIFAANKIRLSTLGFIQYLAPTGQFLIGFFLYKEPLNIPLMCTFVVIWCAIILFSIGSVRRMRRMKEYV